MGTTATVRFDKRMGICWGAQLAGGVLVHEVGHLLRAHAERADQLGSDYDHDRWNLCCDASLNDDLLAAGIRLPEGAVTPGKLGLADGGIEEVYYAQLANHASARHPNSHTLGTGATDAGCGSGAGGPVAPWELAADDRTAPGIGEADASMVRRQVAQAVRDYAANHSRGTFPAGWQRWADATLAGPQVPCRWRDWSAGPQRPAPEALLAAYPDSVTRLNLQHTWRLGPRTTALIRPAFYPDLPFDSARPPRHVQRGGSALPELSLQQVAVMAGPGDAILAATAAERVRDLIDAGFVVDVDGQHAPLHPDDVAVITPHVEQASAIAARLADVPGVLIGTANQMQGLEREAVVVIHPLAGYRDAPPFATDLGWLCVALSRHRAHATVIIDADTDLVLRRAQQEAPNDASLATQRQVLAAMRDESRAPQLSRDST